MLKRWAIIIGCLLGAGTSQATYSGYTYQDVLTIDHTNVIADLTNFPVLVSSNNVVFSTTTSAGGLLNSSGMDLIFSTMSDCSFLLNFDTETVENVGVSTLTVWVNLPSISSTTDTTFYMCYGNSGVTTYQSNSQLTWNSDYQGVFHLANPARVAGSTDTESSHGINAVNSTDAIHYIHSTVGKIGGAALADGQAHSYMQAGTASQFNIVSSGTFSVWIYPTAYAVYGISSILTKGDIGPDRNGVDLAYYSSGPNKMFVDFASASNAQTIITSANSVPYNAWSYLVFVWDANYLYCYINGTLAQAATARSLTPLMTVYPLTFGANSPDKVYAFTGKIDEAQVSSTARSAAWIKTEYNNQNAPETFVAFNATPPPPPPSANAFFFGEM